MEGVGIEGLGAIFQSLELCLIKVCRQVKAEKMLVVLSTSREEERFIQVYSTFLT